MVLDGKKKKNVDRRRGVILFFLFLDWWLGTKIYDSYHL